MKGKSAGRNKNRSIIKKGRLVGKKPLKMNALSDDHISFPYVGLDIQPNTLNEANKQYLNEKNRTCICRSYRQDPCVVSSDIGSKSVIVVLKYDDHVKFLNGQTVDPLGHATYTFGTNGNTSWVCIYDVCSHKISENTRGQGSVMFSCIVYKLKEMFPTAYMWLGIDPRNEYFIPALKSYCNQGFTNPAVVNVDPLGVVNSGVVALIKSPESLDVDDGFSFAHGVYLYNRYQGGVENKFETPFKFDIDIDTVRKLQHLVYTETYRDQNGNEQVGISPQEISRRIVEYSGVLQITKGIVRDNTAVFTLSARKNPNGFLSNVVGQPESVQVEFAPFNYHTHPISAYNSHKRKFGPPSLADFVVVYNGGKNDVQRIQLHLVVTIEGIYFIGTNPQPHIDLRLDQNKILLTDSNDPRNNTYIFEEYTKIITNDPILNFTGDTFTNNSPSRQQLEEYLPYLSNKFNGDNIHNLFGMTFCSWDYLTNGGMVEISSSSVNQNRDSNITIYPILVRGETDYGYPWEFPTNGLQQMSDG